MFNVCWVNEENEMGIHENVPTAKVVQLLNEMGHVDSLTVVTSGSGDVHTYSDPIEVIKLCQYVFNEIPRTRIRHEDFRDSYEVATILDKYLAIYGSSGT